MGGGADLLRYNFLLILDPNPIKVTKKSEWHLLQMRSHSQKQTSLPLQLGGGSMGRLPLSLEEPQVEYKQKE